MNDRNRLSHRTKLQISYRIVDGNLNRPDPWRLIKTEKSYFIGTYLMGKCVI